jgi:hypothetical protein
MMDWHRTRKSQPVMNELTEAFIMGRPFYRHTPWFPIDSAEMVAELLAREVG